jgi:hypothetical protein
LDLSTGGSHKGYSLGGIGTLAVCNELLATDRFYRVPPNEQANRACVIDLRRNLGHGVTVHASRRWHQWRAVLLCPELASKAQLMTEYAAKRSPEGGVDGVYADPDER